MAAGDVATSVGIARDSLSFHLDRLRHADLIKPVRNGRSLIYTARHETMRKLLEYLADHCVSLRFSPRPIKPNPRTRKR
jgi:ArsR family transcriptional regulator, arsenate/arsenite/antimonite-responsive transcriptional repressor